MALNPALERQSGEALFIGQMVIGYSELELMAGICLGLALGNNDVALRTLFRLIGESARIATADALMRGKFQEIGLEAEYAETIGALNWCLRTRNQYAHCHWADDSGGLYFTNLQEPAKAADSFEYWWRHVDIELTHNQLQYFEYTKECLRFLEYEFTRRTKKTRDHPFPMPSRRAQPMPHNPPEEHIPQWITEDQKRQHIARAQAEKTGVPTPTQPQVALEAAREKKRVKRTAHREHSLRDDPKRRE